MHSPAQYRARSRHFPLYRSGPLLFSVATFSLACSLSGCLLRRRPAIPWTTAIQVHPNLQAQASASDDARSLDAPEFNLDLASLAAMMVPARSSPPRPHAIPAPSPAPTAPVAEGERRSAPAITPQLTQEESAAAQQETNQSLDIAERNLASTRGKRLNAAQNDLVSKIKGFLKDAREAAQTGDWARARDLAKKAQVLSEELVHLV
jgi:hypothetical protein